MSQFETGPMKKQAPDPAKPIDSATGRYSHGGTTQEGREKSYKEAGERLKADENARRDFLLQNVNTLKGLELQELKDLMYRAPLGEKERTEAWEKIQNRRK